MSDGTSGPGQRGGQALKKLGHALLFFMGMVAQFARRLSISIDQNCSAHLYKHAFNRPLWAAFCSSARRERIEDWQLPVPRNETGPDERFAVHPAPALSRSFLDRDWERGEARSRNCSSLKRPLRNAQWQR